MSPYPSRSPTLASPFPYPMQLIPVEHPSHFWSPLPASTYIPTQVLLTHLCPIPHAASLLYPGLCFVCQLVPFLSLCPFPLPCPILPPRLTPSPIITLLPSQAPFYRLCLPSGPCLPSTARIFTLIKGLLVTMHPNPRFSQGPSSPQLAGHLKFI